MLTAPQATFYACGMVREPWNFTAPPFAATLAPAAFCCGRPQEEALARLEWLFEERQRFALIVGAEGAGKSHLATAAARRLGGLGAETALLSLRGVSSGEWLDLLLERLPLDHASRVEPTTAWQKLENRLRENRLLERPTVLLVDDLDQAPADAVAGFRRLIGSPEPRFAWTLVVATATAATVANLPDSLRNQAAMRIPLAGWSEADVSRFLAGAVQRVGGDPGIFSPAAAATISRFADGMPRSVCRLAQLALAAAAGDGLPGVDAATVERVWRELAPTEAAAIPAPSSIHRGSPTAVPRPRVRAVRQLFQDG